jgi:hypothetical protein
VKKNFLRAVKGGTSGFLPPSDSSLDTTKYPPHLLATYKAAGCDETEEYYKIASRDVWASGAMALAPMRLEKMKLQSFVEEFARTESMDAARSYVEAGRPSQQPWGLNGYLAATKKKLVENPADRFNSQMCAIIPAMQRVLLSPLQEQQAMGEGIPVEGGVIDGLKKKGMHSKMLPDEYAPKLSIKITKYGLGVFSKQSIKENDFVTSYSGETVTGLRCTEFYSLYAVPILRNLKYVLGDFTGKWTLDHFIKENAVGSILNSSRSSSKTSKTGNVYLDMEKPFQDANGVWKYPMYAKRDIREGEELVWDYNFEAGCNCNLRHHDSDSSGDEAEDIAESSNDTSGLAKDSAPTRPSKCRKTG